MQIMSTPQVTDAARPAEVNGTAAVGAPAQVDNTLAFPPWLRLHNNAVINHAEQGPYLFLHHERIKIATSIPREGVSTVNGNIDWIRQKHQIYRFSGEINVLRGELVVITNAQQGGRPVLELTIISSRGPPRHIFTLPAELYVLTENTDDKVDPAPGVSLSTEPLADVVFTSSLSSSLSNLSLGDEDSIAEQQATLDIYKRAIDTLLYRHEVTAVRIGSFVNHPISIGPLTINIAFDTSTGEGSVTASVIGISLGSAKFSLTKGATIGVDVWLAKARVRVWVQDSGVWLEAHASVRFDGSVDFGPKELFHI
jgi:hypothetical protein